MKSRLFSIWLLLVATIHLDVVAQVHDESRKLDSFKKVLAVSKEDTTTVLLLLQMAESQPEGNCEGKIGYAKQAAAMARKLRWLKGRIASLNSMGMIYKYCYKDYTAAISTYENLVEVLLKNNEKDQIPEAYTDLARIYKAQGQYVIAIDYYQKILNLHPDKSAMMGTLGNIGQIYAELGDYTQALSAYSHSLKILNDTIVINKQISEGYLIMRAGLELTIADIYIITGDYDKALQNQQQALKVENDIIKSVAYQGIGRSYFLKKDFDKSISYYERALGIIRQHTSSPNHEEVLNAMANNYLGKGDIPTAIDYATQAHKLATVNNNEPRLIEIFTTLGRINNHQKKYKDAGIYLQKAIALAQKTGAKNDAKSAWEALSETYNGMHEPAKAFEAYRNFIALRDSVYNTEKAKELTRLDMQSKFDLRRTADSVKQADEKKIADLQLQRQRTMTYSGFAGVVLMLLFLTVIYRNYNNEKKSNAIISRANETIKSEQEVSEKLLLNILPKHVASELKSRGDVEAKRFDHVTVLFTDFVNFTLLAEKLTPEELVAELHECFKGFDAIIARYRIEKIKTVGDAYLAAAGLPDANDNHAADIVNAALEIRDFMLERKRVVGDKTFGIRIGINTGSVVAGIVGVTKFAYDIWGDTVNTAARMEQSGEAGKINISEATYSYIKHDFACTYRGEIAAKNKGEMRMYFVEQQLT